VIGDDNTVKLLQRAKGTLEFDLADRPYGPTDFVAGSVSLKSRRRLGPGKLTVDLVCVASKQRWDGQRRLHIDKMHLFRGSLVCDESAISVPDGPTRRPFTFQVPTLTPRLGDGFPNWPAAVPEIIRAMESWETTLEWALEAHFDLQGLDLDGRRTIVLFPH